MNKEEILHDLNTYTGRFPEDAVRAAMNQLDELTPDLLNALEEAATQPDKVIREDGMLHTFAMFLLGHAREKRAFPPLMQLARLPENQIDGLLGDSITEGLPQALASTAHGDWEALKPLVEDSAAYAFCRSSGLVAMLCMVKEGDLHPEPLLDYCHYLLTRGLEREHSYAWDATVNTACDLGVGCCETAIRQAFDEGLVDSWNASPKDLERALKRDKTGIQCQIDRNHHRYLADCVTEMGWWHAFKPKPSPPKSRPKPRRPKDRPVLTSTPGQPIRRDGPKIGRNDPCPCGSGKKFKKCCGA